MSDEALIDTAPYNIGVARSAHYDNCQIFHPDGKTLLGYCDKHKMLWYLKKNIAESINDTAIKLTFEPKNGSNRPVTAKRENKCSACCATDDLRKFHVVPTEYKKLFPVDVKSHSSADVVLLCKRCLTDGNFCSEAFKRKKEAEYGVSKADFIDHDKERLKLNAIRYLRKKETMGTRPITKEDLARDLGTLSDILGLPQGHTPTDDEIQGFTSLDCNKQKDGATSVPEYIVAKVIASNKLPQFIKEWKENYLDMMAPDYVPDDFMA